MSSKKTLNAKNLEDLGAERLAELLIEISSGNAASKRRLRLELAGTLSPAEVAREVRKRLSTIARTRSFVDWQNQKALVEDLETQRRAIVDQVGRADPAEALDLMWRFLELANRVFERCDDSKRDGDWDLSRSVQRSWRNCQRGEARCKGACRARVRRSERERLWPV